MSLFAGDISRFVLVVAVLMLLSPAFVGGQPLEVLPPDLLDLEIVATETTAERFVVEAIVHPRLDGEFELELVDAEEMPSPQAAGRKRPPRRFRTVRGGETHRERIALRRRAAGAAPVTAGRARVRLNVLDSEGRAWLSIDREIPDPDAEPAPRPARGEERVPILHTRPDGSTLVEYRPRSEVEEPVRGRGAGGADGSAPPQPKPAPGEAGR